MYMYSACCNEYLILVALHSSWLVMSSNRHEILIPTNQSTTSGILLSFSLLLAISLLLYEACAKGINRLLRLLRLLECCHVWRSSRRSFPFCRWVPDAQPPRQPNPNPKCGCGAGSGTDINTFDRARAARLCDQDSQTTSPAVVVYTNPKLEIFLVKLAGARTKTFQKETRKRSSQRATAIGSLPQPIIT